MTSERLGAVIVAAGAAAILVLTIVSSVALTLLAVRKPSSKDDGPNALQRWICGHEGVRTTMVAILAIAAFIPAFLFSGLKAAVGTAVGWARRKTTGGTPQPRGSRRVTPTVSHAEYTEHEERTPPAHAPHETVGVLTGLPVGTSTPVTEAADKPVVSL